MVPFRLIGFLQAFLKNLPFNHFLECPMQLIFPPRNRTKFMITIALLALCPALVTSPAYAATNSGLDTPSGESTLPFAVEGVQGMTLVTQSPTTGPVYVGIGTADPHALLNVRDGVNENLVFRGPISDTTGTEIGSVNDANNTWEPLQLDGSVTILGMAGDVGVGLINPAFKLDVTGDIHASGWLRTGSGVVFPDGTTQTTAAAGHQFGGMYAVDNTCNGQICQGGNPFTGGCSCPAGFSASGAELTGQSSCQNYYVVFCYK
jgi:hypothetical protein